MKRSDFKMQLDHIFAFVDQSDKSIAELESKGLSVSYRRTHTGQGTANACFVFDNAFLELLYATREAEMRSAVIQRTKLWERSQWQALQTCPYGIAWRNSDTDIPTWSFMPPYLPPGTAIPVAIDSDDPRLPMMFTFPGSTAPKQWSEEKRRFPAHPAGWNSITQVELTLPDTISRTSEVLTHVASHMETRFVVTHSVRYSLAVTLGRPDGEQLTLSF